MSCFERLNIDQTIELSPSVIMASVKSNKKKPATYHNRHTSDFCDLSTIRKESNYHKRSSSNAQSNHEPETQCSKKGISMNSKKSSLSNFAPIKISAFPMFCENPKPIHVSKPRTTSPSSTNINMHSQLQSMQSLINSNLFHIQKTLQQHKVFMKKKKIIFSDKFKQVLKLCTQFLRGVLREKECKQNNVFNFISKAQNQCPEIILSIPTDNKDKQKYFVTLDAIAKQVIMLVDQYGIGLDSKNHQIQTLFQYVLCSQKIQLYSAVNFQTQTGNSIRSSGLKNMLSLISEKSQSSQSKTISFSMINQYVSLHFTTTPLLQEHFGSFLHHLFLQHFTKQQGQGTSSNKKSPSPTFSQQAFPTYEFHPEPSNLAAFVPSYQQRNHFLLDKFTQGQNIFEDQQKLELLLKLSRDPYMPRSSAKYISHISQLVEDIFGWEDKGKSHQTEQNSEGVQEIRQRQEKAKYDLQVEQELKLWDEMFGELVLRI